MNRRHLLLGAALALTLLAVWQTRVDEQRNAEDDLASTAAMPAPAAKTGQAVTPAATERMHDASADIFAVKDWNPPPVVESVPAKPARPLPPPLPYRYLGRWEENGTRTLILGREDRSIPAHSGQVLDGVWRIEKISATDVEFTYLPLKTTDHLTLEEPQ